MSKKGQTAQKMAAILNK